MEIKTGKPLSAMRSGGAEPIPDTRFGKKVAGSCRISFQLLTEVTHVDAQVVAAFHIGRSPDLPQQLAVGQHLAGFGDQCRQQPKLDGRDVDRLAVTHHLSMLQIHGHIAEVDGGGAGIPLALAPAIPPFRTA